MEHTIKLYSRWFEFKGTVGFKIGLVILAYSLFFETYNRTLRWRLEVKKQMPSLVSMRREKKVDVANLVKQKIEKASIKRVRRVLCFANA